MSVATGMEVGFFFWPYDPDLVRRMATRADRYGYALAGIADTPGNAMDPWVATTMLAAATQTVRVAVCVTNLVTRHAAVSAASIASIDLIAPGRTVLGLGVGHSGTHNLGLPRSTVAELETGVRCIKQLLTGEPSAQGGGSAHLPWVKRAPKVFLAASGPQTLALAGRVADGVFINFGITAENMRQSEAIVTASAIAAGRDPADIEIWQIASLDCNEDGAAARRQVGAILAFMAGGYILDAEDLSARGVPEALHAAVRELRRRYSTRPGDADAHLVAELGLFDYLTQRFAIYGTPEHCLEQMQAARRAGLRRVMFTVSVASDPVRTVELFGERVMPQLAVQHL